MAKAQPLGCLLALCILFMQSWVGCSSTRLHRFEQRAAKGEYRWIARQDAGCDQASDTCGRLHLIKGNACLQTADSDPEPQQRYACAADELEKGLALIPDWTDQGLHRQVREDFCRSLLNLWKRQPVEKADQTLSRLSDAAKGLFQLAPESASATYYLACVPLYRAQTMPPETNPAARIPVCNRLTRSLTRVLSKMETAKLQPPADWDRFAASYERLSFELGMTILTAQCR